MSKDKQRYAIERADEASSAQLSEYQQLKIMLGYAREFSKHPLITRVKRTLDENRVTFYREHLLTPELYQKIIPKIKDEKIKKWFYNISQKTYSENNSEPNLEEKAAG